MNFEDYSMDVVGAVRGLGDKGIGFDN